MNNMVELLRNSKDYIFEKKNSFDYGIYPCFYVKKKYGFVVFFVYSDESIDYVIFDSKKRLIILIENINFYDEEFSRKVIENSKYGDISYPDYLINRNKKSE